MQTKHLTYKPVSLPTSLHVAKALWQEVTVDLVIDLPKDKGYTRVCTIIDRFSKEIVFFPITKNVSMINLAQGFKNHVWKCHGTLQSVLSNCGSQFISLFT